MENQEQDPKPTAVDILLDVWSKSHHPHATMAGQERCFASINEIMAFLNNSTDRVDQEQRLDAEYVIKKLQLSDYESTEMGGVLHIIYY